MPLQLNEFLERHRLRFMRYAGVSLFGVVLGQAILLTCYEGLGLPAITSNVIAVSLSTIPVYLLNRLWVWGKSGDHSLTGEILPFWGFAFVGLILSTLAVAWVHSRWESALLVAVANLSAFGVLWIAKYFVIDLFLFADAGVGDPVTEPDHVG